QRVPLCRRESAQVPGAVVVAKAGQLLHDFGFQIADVDALDPHRAQVLEAVEVAQDDRWSRLGWVLLELELRRVRVPAAAVRIVTLRSPAARRCRCCRTPRSSGTPCSSSRSSMDSKR